VVTRCGRTCLGKKKLIAARSLLDRPSGSKRFTTTYGWSALWIMIWDTSIWRLGCSDRSKIPGPKVLSSDRYVVSPMSPGRTIDNIGGASRDRTDDLIVANDVVCQSIAFVCLELPAEYGPFRSNSKRKNHACREFASLPSSDCAH